MFCESETSDFLVSPKPIPTWGGQPEGIKLDARECSQAVLSGGRAGSLQHPGENRGSCLPDKTQKSGKIPASWTLIPLALAAT